MLVVAALGGNALLKRGESLDANTQRRNVRLAAQALAPIAAQHSLVVTHGNGPQVGLLALQAEAYAEVEPYPLDVLGAQSEGMIGYLLEQELRRVLPQREIATLLTQVEVDTQDPGFRKPTKPIGPIHPEEKARALAAQRGWSVAAEQTGGFRRVVASPEPRKILELASIRLLLDAGVLTICAGGGGIPVARDPSGTYFGVEAVIDKDAASALLAAELGADALLLLTDQPAIFADWPEPARRPLACLTPDQLDALSLDAGSMGPKAQAAARFATRTGRRAAIGALADASRILEGSSGTSFAPAGARPA